MESCLEALPNGEPVSPSPLCLCSLSQVSKILKKKKKKN